ncbi:MAG: SET domain-containing protein [Methanothrix sp.]|nr:SET domain-containing protein [Methanothrix sp.]
MYLTKIYKNSSCIDGRGIFAGEPIPKGTVVFYYSSNDAYVLKKEFQSLPDSEREQIQKLGLEDESGNWIVTDGDANHSCDANILSMFVDGIYCDIAVKDIKIGEEITIDYGLFYSSFPWQMKCRCHSNNCRGVFGSAIPVDFQTQQLWHLRISEAAGRIFQVTQPLFARGDESARALRLALRSKQNPEIFPYTKFSLISNDPKMKI